MPKLFSSVEIIKVLQRKGPALTAIVPAGKKEIPMGTFKSILRQANLMPEEFQK